MAEQSKSQSNKHTARRGRPFEYTEEDPRITVSVSMPTSARDKLKMYAMQQHRTASDVIVALIGTLETQ